MLNCTKFKHIQIIVIMLFFMVSMFSIINPVSSVEAVVYVDDDYTTQTPGWDDTHFDNIADGIINVAEGGTIFVADGTYDLSSPLTVTKPIEILGNVTNPGNVIVNAPTSGDDKDVFQIVSNDVTIEGFKIQGAKDVMGNVAGRTNAGILVGGDYLSLGSKPTDAEDFTLSGSAWWALSVSNVVIRNNVVTDNSYGIFLFHAQDVVISNNIIHSNTTDADTWSGKGIEIYSSMDFCDDANADDGTGLQHTKNVFISNNDIFENGLFGIELNHSENWHSSNISGPYNVNVQIIGNSIHDNGGPLDNLGTNIDLYRGISANGNEEHVVVINNEIYGHIASFDSRFNVSCAGMRLRDTSNWTISQNEIYGNLRGVYAYGSSSSIDVSKNDIHDNAQGIVMADGTTGSVSDNSIHHNNLTLWETDGISPFGVLNITGTTSLDASYNWWGSNLGPYHPILNPSGYGDRVGDKVIFRPWIREEVSTVASLSAITSTHLTTVNNMLTNVQNNLPSEVPSEISESLETVQEHISNASGTSNAVFANGELMKSIGILHNVMSQI